MNKEIIETALREAYYFLNNEIQAVELEELRDDYLQVIEKLKIALNEITKDE